MLWGKSSTDAETAYRLYLQRQGVEWAFTPASSSVKGKAVMNTRITAIAIALLIGLSVGLYRFNEGDTIRVHCNNCNIDPHLNHLSELLASANIKLISADKLAADVDISIVPTDQMPGADVAGSASPLTGHIDLNQNYINTQESYVIVLHEILHCAGVGHEPDDPSSLMHTHAHTFGQMRERHIKSLRRLSGITKIGRIGALLAVIAY